MSRENQEYHCSLFLIEIFEKLMYHRLKIFLDKNNILFKSQYGFCAKQSTQHAIIQNNMGYKIIHLWDLYWFKKGLWYHWPCYFASKTYVMPIVIFFIYICQWYSYIVTLQINFHSISLLVTLTCYMLTKFWNLSRKLSIMNCIKSLNGLMQIS